MFKNHKTIFSIVDEPPSWSDVDDSLESMSEPDEEDDIPEDKDSSRSGPGDEEVYVHEESHEQEDEEDSDGDFLMPERALASSTASLLAQRRRVDKARATQKMISSDP